jgi:flavin-dependent dehydrogenase
LPVSDDVLIVGAGPAGAVAATVLARAGARVRIIDRAHFPREKLCGDTVNPGTLERLGRLGLAASVETAGLPVRGMLVTGEGGTTVEGRYPDSVTGRAIRRHELDWILLQHAIAAGAAFEPGVMARAALAGDRNGSVMVEGVEAGSARSRRAMRARVTIAADGRHSTVAFGLGLARHPATPRRWAIGAYFDRAGTVDLGEMHIRRDRYVGVAGVPGGLTNVCVVRAIQPGRLGDPSTALRHAIGADALLADRFLDAPLVGRPHVLGPLAVDIAPARAIPDGLLLAGDASGFIDPMTGDGMQFAVAGGELAAAAALEALTGGWPGVQTRLAWARRREFAGKWRFNRLLRALVGSATGVRAATAGARLAPAIVRAIVVHAGDCPAPHV